MARAARHRRQRTQNQKKEKSAKKRGRNRRAATGIDIGTYSVKVVTLYVDDGDSLDFKKVTVVPVSEDDPKADTPASLLTRQKNALKDALKQHKTLEGKIVLGYPRKRAMVRYLTLPSDKPDELREMLNFDVERHVPFSMEELEVSFAVLGKPNENETRVMMVCAPQNELKPYTDICKELNLNVSAIYPDVMGDNYAYSRNAQPDETLAVVNFGRSSVNLGVYQNRKMLFSRSLSSSEEALLEGFPRAKGWHDLQGRVTTAGVLNPNEREHFSSWVENLNLELLRSAHAFTCEHAGHSIDRMILSGGSGYFPAGPPKGMAVQLKTKVTIESALNGDLPPSDDYQGTELSTAVGLALCGTDPALETLNLLPDAFTYEQQSIQRAAFRKNVAILSLMVLMLLGGTGYLMWYERYTEASAVNQYFLNLRQETTELESMRKKIQVVENYIDHEHSALNVIQRVLEELEKMPEKVYVRNITFNKRETLEFNGQTLSNETVNQINRMLNTLKPKGSSETFFQSVRNRNTAVKALNLGATELQVYEFGFSCILRWKESEAKVRR